MDMSMDMSMPMSATTTGSMSMPTSAGMGGMSMGGSDMDMMGGCKISMTWNWYTVGACFISKSWQVKSSGMFAGSCFGVIFLVISLEFLRRVQRGCESFIVRRSNAGPSHAAESIASSSSRSDVDVIENGKAPTVGISSARPDHRPLARKIGRMRLVKRQIIRSTLHMLQFAVAYFVMLLAMYYNGYIIFCIVIGAWLGYFAFTWDTLLLEEASKESSSGDVTGCCG